MTLSGPPSSKIQTQIKQLATIEQTYGIKNKALKKFLPNNLELETSKAMIKPTVMQAGVNKQLRNVLPTACQKIGSCNTSPNFLKPTKTVLTSSYGEPTPPYSLKELIDEMMIGKTENIIKPTKGMTAVKSHRYSQTYGNFYLHWNQC